MGATCHCEFAVPPAPQAGLNNGIEGLQTLSPAKKEQAAPAHPDPLTTFDGPAFHGRACVGRVLVWLIRLSVALPLP